MAAPTVHIGPRKVVLAGNVISSDNDLIRISIDDNAFEIAFETKPGDPPSFNSVIKGNALKITLTNADSPQGSSVIIPAAKLVGGKELLLALFVQSLTSNRARLVTYNFLQ